MEPSAAQLTGVDQELGAYINVVLLCDGYEDVVWGSENILETDSSDGYVM